MIETFDDQLFEQLNISVHSFDIDSLTWEYRIFKEDLQLIFTYGIDRSFSIYIYLKQKTIFSYFSFGLLTLKLNEGKICAVFDTKINVSIDLENMYVEVITESLVSS